MQLKFKNAKRLLCCLRQYTKTNEECQAKWHGTKTVKKSVQKSLGHAKDQAIIKFHRKQIKVIHRPTTTKFPY